MARELNPEKFHTIVADDDGVIFVVGLDGRPIAQINLFDHGDRATIDVIVPEHRELTSVENQSKARHRQHLPVPTRISAMAFRFRPEVPAPTYTVNESGSHHEMVSPNGLIAVLIGDWDKD